MWTLPFFAYSQIVCKKITLLRPMRRKQNLQL